MELLDLDLLDPTREDLVRSWYDVLVADGRARMGDLASTWELHELQTLQQDPARPRRSCVAVEDGRAVGAAWAVLPQRDNRQVAELAVWAHPEHTGRGVGSALLAHVEELARGEGRTVLQTGSEALVDSVDPACSFAPAHGYDQAQVVLRSGLALADDEAWRDRMAEIAAGGGVAATPDPDAVRLKSVTDLPPPEWYDGLALLNRRMSTDAPLGDMVLEEEDWDAERVRSTSQRALDMGRRLATTVAFDRDGAMVGYTEVGVSSGTPHLGYQGATLVLREARGRRIGLRLKAANALHLRRALPGVTSVRTWNAEENAPMLAVNRALGYVVDGVQREWQKTVTA